MTVERSKLFLLDADENETVVKFGTKDILKWERAGNTKADLGNEDKALEAIFSLAHSICVQRGMFEGSLDEFIDAYDVYPEPDAKAPKGSK